MRISTDQSLRIRISGQARTYRKSGSLRSVISETDLNRQSDLVRTLGRKQTGCFVYDGAVHNNPGRARLMCAVYNVIAGLMTGLSANTSDVSHSWTTLYLSFGFGRLHCL